jgi:FixJ family two-component response regulator
MPVRCERSPPELEHEQAYVVDDDEAVADSLELLLEGFGYDVQSYNPGADFLADDRHCRTGCLIIDRHMPGLDGIDVVTRLQEEAPLPSILVSGRLDTNTKKRAGSLGVAGVLEKPFAADHLIGLIRKALLERH